MAEVILKILSYMLIIITGVTLIFGVIAHYLYKMREYKIIKSKSLTAIHTVLDDKYMFFVQREVRLWAIK